MARIATGGRAVRAAPVAIIVSVESTDFWAQIAQLIAVLALALVIEVRAMYQRVQAIEKSRTKGTRIAIALMYAFAVLGLLSSFLTGLSGMTGAPISSGHTRIVVYALIFTFFVLVVVPTIPLIWALIEDLPFSPDGVARLKLSRLRAQVDQAFQQVDRAARATRLDAMSEACAKVVEASRSGASDGGDDGLLLGEALERFQSARHLQPDLGAARDEIETLLGVLADGNDLTTEEARRWRAASSVIRAAGGRLMP